VLRGVHLVLLAAVAALALTACGASADRPAAAPAAAAPKAKVCKNQAAALAKIRRDIVALDRAAKLPTSNRLIGNHAINIATDKFLYDVAVAPITNLQRNRLIDHAMSAIGTKCQQCFQAFEAGRPIPSIRAGHVACGQI
jgi:hypothetical protein